MQFYHCNIRPGGDLGHEVPKKDISAAEIMVLQYIHGNDAVVDIRQGKSNKKPGLAKKEYEKLMGQYGPAPVKAMFGEGYNVQLPDRLEQSDPVAEVN